MTTGRTPLPLVVAAGITALEALALAAYGVLELAHLSGGRVTMGVTTALFFLAAAVALGWCAAQLLRLQRWARSPVVLTQLMMLGLAWNFRAGDTTAIAVVLAAVAVVGLVSVFHPASLRALEEAESGS